MPRRSVDPLAAFHPLIARWFRERFRVPTDIQAQAWPRIAAGGHVLITAPTGSGKTLTAFLWALNQLITGRWPTGGMSVLYVSPLKALNNDIQRNLLEPLRELEAFFQKVGEAFPNIRVLTRSGDTPQEDRRRMQRHPPEILITTPESLNLLLSSQSGRALLPRVKSVILDEIHAVAGNKRGVYLISAVDRLVRLAGEFQRVALSATVRPLERVAEFVGGYEFNGDADAPVYHRRAVMILTSSAKKEYAVQVCFPEEAARRDPTEPFWEPLAAECKRIIARHRSTLIFVNNRALCEKLTLLINQGEPALLAYAHHGSLAREIRHEVERKLKAGELKAIVATNSLEMGIDIGALDEVVMVQCPPSVSSAVQRVGRAGHRVGEVSRGTMLPTHARDFIEAAVLAPSITCGDIEALKMVKCPLDVLAQIIVSMAGTETWRIDELFAWLRASEPFHALPRRQFDLVLNMLAGRYADSRVRELKPRLALDAEERIVASRQGALQALYFSGGVIPDRGYFHLRHAESSACIGELDEEFVWERRVGESFTFGTQQWRIERITHNDVLVRPANPKAPGVPFWKGEEIHRDFHFSERIGLFLKEANAALAATKKEASASRPLGKSAPPHVGGYENWRTALAHQHCLDALAAAELIRFLQEQRQVTQRDLPHRHHLLVEVTASGPGGAPGCQVVLHTLWGGRVNQPFAMALGAAWEERFGHRIEIHAGNDCLALVLPHDVRPAELLSLVTSGNVERLLRQRLEHSGYFAARFRENAGRALLLSRSRPSERLPLWMNRLRAQKLMEAVAGYDDFPILLETWRTCLQDEFDVENLRRVLAELETGAIRWTEARTGQSSPFARSVAWRQVNEYMYRGDEPMAGRTSRLRASLIEELTRSPELRPTVPRVLVERFEQKRQRLAAGYAPDSAIELREWLKERVLMPEAEWVNLLAAIRRDHGEEADAWPEAIRDKWLRLRSKNARVALIVSAERTTEVLAALRSGGADWSADGSSASSITKRSRGRAVRAPDAAAERELDLAWLLCEWLTFYGPRDVESLPTTLDVTIESLTRVLDELVEAQSLIRGRLTDDASADEICDTENFERLLRMKRAEAVAPFEPLELKWLPVFLAQHQGLLQASASADALASRLEQLVCLPASAELWEAEILPARLPRYQTAWLDAAMPQGHLKWLGTGREEIAFCFEDELDLCSPPRSSRGHETLTGGRSESPHVACYSSVIEQLFTDPAARYDFTTLLGKARIGAAELSEILWAEVWAGRVTNDTFAALRRAIQNRFKVTVPVPAPPTLAGRSRRVGSRGAFSHWKGSLPAAGNWHLLAPPAASDDLLDAEERKKDRVRILLDRYGVLFRELLANELSDFRWSALFRTLRLMELSGEVLSGCFFHGVPGPQFISHEAFRQLQRGVPTKTIFWLNAADPISPCGLALEALRGTVPKRLPATHLVFRGPELVVISQRHAHSLTIKLAPSDSDLPEALGFLHHLLRREFQPLARVSIETINDEPATKSPYAEPLRRFFHATTDYKALTIYRRLEA